MIMALRSIAIGIAATVFAAAFFMMAPPIRAGAHVRAGTPPTTRSPAATAAIVRVVPQAVAVSVVVTTPGQAAKAPLYVDLRGPDGTVRRFPVEGGRGAIQSTHLVLRSGQSVTIQLVGAK
jgi:hypothetical protein